MFGGQIYSIPCHACCFALGQFEEQDELHQAEMDENYKVMYSALDEQVDKLPLSV